MSIVSARQKGGKRCESYNVFTCLIHWNSFPVAYLLLHAPKTIQLA